MYSSCNICKNQQEKYLSYSSKRRNKLCIECKTNRLVEIKVFLLDICKKTKKKMLISVILLILFFVLPPPPCWCKNGPFSQIFTNVVGAFVYFLVLFVAPIIKMCPAELVVTIQLCFYYTVLYCSKIQTVFHSKMKKLLVLQ